MGRAKRPDRYCTETNAPLVLTYMLSRLEQVASLFKIRGVHRAAFKQQMEAMSGLSGQELYQSLHTTCCSWDKSGNLEFAEYKGRVRRYLHSKRMSQLFYVSNETKLLLDKFTAEEGLQGADEAIGQLLKFWHVSHNDFQKDEH